MDITGADKDRGSLSVGKRADIVIFDKDINIKMTMVKGKVIKSKTDCQNDYEFCSISS